MSATGSPPPRRGEAGFTLIEVLAVLAVTALVAGIGFPVLSGAFAHGREAEARGLLRLALAQARADAIAGDRPVTLAPAAAGTALAFSSARAPLPLPAGTRLEWPGITFAADGAGEGAPGVLIGEGGRHAFTPATGASLRFAP